MLFGVEVSKMMITLVASAQLTLNTLWKFITDGKLVSRLIFSLSIFPLQNNHVLQNWGLMMIDNVVHVYKQLREGPVSICTQSLCTLQNIWEIHLQS